jgi:hypothetical protein
MDLPLAQERVQHRADVVDRDIERVSCTSPVSASTSTSARCAPLGKVAAPFGPKLARSVNPVSNLVGQLGGVEGVLGHRCDVDHAVGAGDDELTVREDNIGARRLHHVGGDVTTLVDQLDDLAIPRLRLDCTDAYELESLPRYRIYYQI